MNRQLKLTCPTDSPVPAQGQRAIAVRFQFKGLLRVALLIAATAFLTPTLNAQTGEWAWMSGTSTFTCTQPPTIPPTCTDPVGFYGTLGVPAAGNVPGSRGYQATWTDSNGILWLFGGVGFASKVLVNDDQLNDLWEFNPSTEQWTWMGGSSDPPNGGSLGVYGTRGVPDALNIPSGRGSAAAWTDAAGKLWLFGGSGTLGGNSVGDLDDLWKFDPSTLKWTWVSGYT